MDNGLLSLLVFLPLAGALCTAVFRKRPAVAGGLALVFTLVELGAAGTAGRFAAVTGTAPFPGFFLWQDYPWIDRFGIRYLLGMDGISFAMVLLASFLTVVAILVSWNGHRERSGLFYTALLVMESGVVGIFLALDLFLFYLFWEIMLVPIFLLVGIWGDGQRVYAALKYFMYSFAGSLFMLLAIIGLYLAHGAQTGFYTFALPDLLGTPLSSGAGFLLFVGFLLAFAVKTPLFPVHSWVPDAYGAAPVGAVLAGLLLKTGAYGLIRFAIPLFPDAARAATPLLYALALVGILYGSWIAYVQTDMRRLVAYSTIGHMGFVALGIAAWTPVALSGAVVQMLNQGITSGGLFVLIAALERRTGTRDLSRLGGLWSQVPVFAGFFLLFAMASAGLPGLNNFVGEFLVLVGSFRAAPLPAVLALAGILLSLIYTVRLVQGLLFGGNGEAVTSRDLTAGECAVMAILALVALSIGAHPTPLLDLLKTPVALLVPMTGGLP